MALLKHGKFATNPSAGGVAYILWYYQHHEQHHGKSKRGKPYPSHKRECVHCGKSFRVYHYPKHRWSPIKYCSLDCCWLHTYGRPFLVGEEERRRLRQKNWRHQYRCKRDTTRLLTHLTSLTPIALSSE